MRVQSRLMTLALAVALPLVLLAGLVTWLWWDGQRKLNETRSVEHVKALALALDTEMSSNIRILQDIGFEIDSRASLSLPARRQDFARNTELFLMTVPFWNGLAVMESDGRVVTSVARPGKALFMPPAALLTAVKASHQPAFSDLLTDGAGHYGIAMVVPLRSDGQLLVSSVDQHGFRSFFDGYAGAPGSTITLLDRTGTIVARTLANDRFVGHRPAPAVIQHAANEDTGAYISPGLEGYRFYIAHAHTPRWHWTVATGNPANAVEAELRSSVQWVALGALGAMALACLAAMIVGRRIARPISELAERAALVVDGQAPEPQTPWHVAEVDAANEALDNASRLLRARQEALSAALDREREARAEAETANVAKDRFLAMLGHELRNPLNGILNATRVLNLPNLQETLAQRSREVLERQSRHLAALLDDLLDVARVTSGKIVLKHAPVDVSALTQQVVQSLKDSRRMDQHVLSVSVDGPLWVSGDATRLEQVMVNILENALKYTLPGGRIEVRLSADNDCVNWSVQDNGIGIAPEFLERIFDLFAQGIQSLDRSQGGLGLGLTLVKNLVELHGGRVKAMSEGPGKGSVFAISLPRMGDPQGQQETKPANSAPALRQCSIVLVEDDADSRAMIEALLREAGHTLQVETTGSAAVPLIVSSAPDLALVDIGLPGLDGFGVAQAVRLAHGKTVLVALSGYGRREDRERAIAAGFDHYLIKPLSLAQLQTIIARLPATGNARP